MKPIAVIAALAALAGVSAAGPAAAQSRYVNRPPVIVSPDLNSPWVVQFEDRYGRTNTLPTYYRSVTVAPPRQAGVIVGPPGTRAGWGPAPQGGGIDPAYLPARVAYSRGEAPGTILIDTRSRYLYLVLPGHQAIRYGVGVGREGFLWKGSQRISRKAEWPDWTPPAEMRKRQPWLPRMMKGGVDNPLGARALYLGSSLYRIHGTSEPWTIGHAVSSGCIRLRNEDVIDLYNRVKVGTRVVVI
jgi:lipoprotein-anchoring transpeptidase ErfK/SrfK